MKEPLIWLGQLPPGAAAGAPFLEMLVVRDQKKRFIPTCSLGQIQQVEQYSLPTYLDVEYVRRCQQDLAQEFRLIPWEKNIDYMLAMAKDHSPQCTWFGTLFDTTLHQCKAMLGDQCRTVSMNYDYSSYDLVRRKWARWHTGIIVKNDKYKHVKENFKSVQDIEQWLLESGSEQFGFVIPRQHHVSADIEIDVKDIWDQTQFSILLDQLGCKFSQQDWAWYQDYCKDSG